MSSRGRHSQGLLVAVSSGEMWIASQRISEVDHPGFGDGLSCEGQGTDRCQELLLSNREGEELQE